MAGSRRNAKQAAAAAYGSITCAHPRRHQQRPRVSNAARTLTSSRWAALASRRPNSSVDSNFASITAGLASLLAFGQIAATRYKAACAMETSDQSTMSAIRAAPVTRRSAARRGAAHASTDVVAAGGKSVCAETPSERCCSGATFSAQKQRSRRIPSVARTEPERRRTRCRRAHGASARGKTRG